MQQIKHHFFTYRNGVVAETLRRYGDPHKTIFGLSVPQLAEIARGIGTNNDMAEELWNDKNVRESRLLATYLFNPEEIDMETAVALATDVVCQEEADMLTFRLLKRLPFAKELLGRLEKADGCEKVVKSLIAHLG